MLLKRLRKVLARNLPLPTTLRRIYTICIRRGEDVLVILLANELLFASALNCKQLLTNPFRLRSIMQYEHVHKQCVVIQVCITFCRNFATLSTVLMALRCMLLVQFIRLQFIDSEMVTFRESKSEMIAAPSLASTSCPNDIHSKLKELILGVEKYSGKISNQLT